MQIAGIQKTTLVDYPGKVAATVFTRGCSFRCGFCHNPELVIPEEFNPLMPEEEILDFLKNRVGKLQAVCITGGEPTIQKDIREFIKKIKEMGYLVKLDSNGSRPEVLEKIIADGNIDYIAIDIKASPEKYSLAAGLSSYSDLSHCHSERSEESHHRHFGPARRQAGLYPESSSLDCHSHEGGNLMSDIRRSIKMIMDSGIDYEFRTTVCHPIHEVDGFTKIGELIKGAKRYYIQNFVESKQINKHQKYSSFSDDELEKTKNIMSQYISEVSLR